MDLSWEQMRFKVAHKMHDFFQQKLAHDMLKHIVEQRTATLAEMEDYLVLSSWSFERIGVMHTQYTIIRRKILEGLYAHARLTLVDSVFICYGMEALAGCVIPPDLQDAYDKLMWWVRHEMVKELGDMKFTI